MIVAGAYGAATVSRRILLVQALPALLALVAVLVAALTARSPLSSQPRNASRLAVDSPRSVAPLPLLADRGGEAQLEDRVERLVGVGEHRAEQPVELVGRHRADSGSRASR